MERCGDAGVSGNDSSDSEQGSELVKEDASCVVDRVCVAVLNDGFENFRDDGCGHSCDLRLRSLRGERQVLSELGFVSGLYLGEDFREGGCVAACFVDCDERHSEWLVQVHWAVDCLDVGLVCHASCVSVQFDHGGLNVDHFVSSFGQDGVVQDLRCDFQRCLMSSDEVVVDSSADVEEPCAVLELDGLDDSLSEGFQV